METSKAVREAITSHGSSANAFGQGSSRTLPMKVIVCGLGRTGTTNATSLWGRKGTRTALNILGFRAYHSTDLWLDSQENVESWMRAFDWKYQGKGKPFDRLQWDEILGDYMSTIDAPAQFFAAELAEAYPDAKVVVLNRDFDSWFESCVAALSGYGRFPWSMYFIFFWDSRLLTLGRYMAAKQRDVWGFEWQEPGARDKAKRFFDDYYGDFRARIPENRRLEFSVRDGWEPLCKHLGVEVPTMLLYDGEGGSTRVEVPFPQTNEAGEFKGKVGKVKNAALKAALLDWTRALVLTAVVGYTAAPYVVRLSRSLVKVVHSIRA
ncbi:hypothetical protein BX600DRAFT_442997 [Xylariales sp. PMI_506]|nr:hypothetical protein BX600DRAFT_442997 [Xylariales sp. PMI_506]